MTNLETVKENHNRFRKALTIINLKDLLDELFLECEHGDQDHRQWLKDKFEDFRKRKEDESYIN